ncbi:hypothetical protein DPMN_110758 [Dreissena polymorpha]|uniref:Uncharacterized protein n=1 Tax=Dreissena polymorpha TaxID=45954 RepID=A0A9D4KDS4_DREPO|nr:hypothetical protein DPMN_110758 [Dreissena polymorpha]
MMKEMESIKGMLQCIKGQLETQGNTNQQLAMTMVNLAGAITSMRTQPAQMPPAVPVTQPSMQTEAPQRRVKDGIRERGRHQDQKRKQAATVAQGEQQPLPPPGSQSIAPEIEDYKMMIMNIYHRVYFFITVSVKAQLNG